MNWLSRWFGGGPKGPTNSSNNPASPTTALFCIESGFFEAQTVLAIESLRRFGGRLAQAPVLAITPRLGPSLTRATRRRLDELGVTYIRKNLRHPLSWYGFLNKPLAVLLAEEHATTEEILWLDCDILIAAEPELLLLGPDCDFAVCSTDKNIASTGPEDKSEAYWVAICQCMGMDVEQLPWVVTEFEKTRVRFSFNAGIFAFRRNKGLARKYLTACEKLVNSRIAYRGLGIGNNEQPALGLAVLAAGLRFRMLPESHNYCVEDIAGGPYRREGLPSARILHYHQMLSKPRHTAWMLGELEGQLPELHAWLKGRVPLDTRLGGPHRRLMRRLLQKWRYRKAMRFETGAPQFGG